MDEQNNLQPNQTNVTPPEKKSSTGLDENIASLLCYLGTFITGIIFFVLEKQSPTVKYHAMQSTVTFLGLWILQYVVDFIPFIGWLLNMFISLAMVILWVILMIKAYKNEMLKLPIVSDIAENLIEKFKGSNA